MMVAMPRQSKCQDTVGCSSDNFIHNSLVFDESIGPIAADNCISNFQDLAEALNCTDSQKVDYVRLKPNGEAKYWWKSTKVLLAEELGPNVPIT
jgi:hypothetical protein